jgi:septum formation protein
MEIEAAPRLVLASGSPRRRQLLNLLGIPYRIRAAELDETQLRGESARDFARRAAREKAVAIAMIDHDLPVLGSDTVVEIDHTTLGKPESAEAADEMLRCLSGRSHQVHTGMALAVGDECSSLVDSTVVRFRELSEEMIDWYVATGEALDKAGAYAVQGCGGLLVEAIDGSPHTVVGLPIHRLPELFAMSDLDFWKLL